MERLFLTSWQLLLAIDTFRGYSLKDKLWLELQLSYVKAITWNDEAFSSLVLPDDTRNLVLTFVQSQIQRDQTFDDVIQGKAEA
jgi:hypothetical protein